MGRFTKFSHVTFSILFIFSLALQGIQPVAAQDQGSNRTQHHPVTGKLSFVGASMSRPIVVHGAQAAGLDQRQQALAMLAPYANDFGLPQPNRDLRLERAESPKGRRVTRFQQTYRGIPVMAGELVVNADNQGGLLSIDGEIAPDLELGTTPAITAGQARQTALESLAKWNKGKPSDFAATEPQLWIYDARLLHPDGIPAALVWRMDVTSHDSSLPLRELVLIDAQRGNIRLHFNQVDTAWSSEPLAARADESPTPEPTLEPAPIPAQPTQQGPVIPEGETLDSLSGTPRYVATTGTDSGTCTSTGSPCHTINYAIGQAAAGDTVAVAAGTYTGSGLNPVVLILKNVTVSGGWVNSYSSQSGESIIDGQAARQGVNIVGGPATLDRFTITNGDGGGISISGTTTTLKNLTVTANKAQDGGGINITASTVTIDNSVIAGNEATQYGGGIFAGPLTGFVEQSHITINNSTIVHNKAWEGGGYMAGNVVLTARNTILAYNTALTSAQCNGFGAPFGAAPSTHNLILDHGDCSAPADSYSDADPMLTATLIGSPGFYGLRIGSPALDAGDPASCLPTDQRGIARPQGAACDIGAYERATSPQTAALLAIGSGAGQRTPALTQLSIPLSVYVLDANGSFVPGATVTFTAPASGASGTFGDGLSADVVSDLNGLATAPAFKTNAVNGSYLVTATSPGASPAQLSLTNAGWYVATTGTDSNSCSSPASPCASLSGALNKASTGDTIKVAAQSFSTVQTPVDKTVTISGGWNDSFTTITGFTTLNASTRGLYIYRGGNPSGPTVSIDRFIIQGVTSSYSGGAIAVQDSSTLTLSRSSLRNNSSYYGAGIYSMNSTVNLRNVTIRNNAANGYNRRGGGIYFDGGQLNIENGTVVDNTSTIGGGLYYINTTTITIRDSILANNSSTGGSGPDCYRDATTYGGITVLDHSLVENSADCSLPSGSGNVIGQDPGTMPYVASGGYYTLVGNNAALDAGNSATCLSDDQRGVSRPQGAACDMGAYEAAITGGTPNTMVLLSGSGQHSVSPYPFTTPFSVYLLDADSNPIYGASVTFTAPASGPSGTFEGGSSDATVVTGSGGIATAPPFTPNSIEGVYTINVTAGAVNTSLSLENRAFYVAPGGNDGDTCLAPAHACLTINGAISKGNGDYIFVASGTYTGSGSIPVVTISNPVTISGGWNSAFSAQTGRSIVDGQNARKGIVVNPGVTAGLLDLNVQNAYGDHGAGIYSQGILSLSRVTVSGNRATEDGGGIYQAAGQLNLVNVTVSNNGAKSSGGGIFVNNGSLTLNNVTVTQNLTSDPNYESWGGGLSNPSNQPVTISNSIVAGNTAVRGPDCRGALTSGGHNLIGFNDGACTLTTGNGDLVGTTTSPRTVMLGNLADNGGTTLTHAPLVGSPVIDAGSSSSCAPTDQRGVARPQGASCDTGSVEGSTAGPVGAVVRTYTSHNAADLPGIFLCDQSQPGCTYGADPSADAAHIYALGTYGLYADHFGRRSIDGNNMPLVSSVHYQTGASAYDNAFWSGAQMIYGDGHGYARADDVVTHELTHGVTQYESNLFYFYQSGAISESLSDVFAELYDQSNGMGTDTPAVKWLVGEDVTGLGALRSMSDPPAYGDPDTMSSTNYDWDPYEFDNGGVHTNSGINNKAAYLLVDVDAGRFNGKTVTALGADKTLAIYYEVNTNLLTSGSDYADLYVDLYQACLNLVGGAAGITASDCQSVQNATDAVEMNGAPSSTYNPEAPLCAAGNVPVNVFFDGFENGTGNWLFSSPRWQIDSPFGPYAHIGTHSLYADDLPDTTADVVADMKNGVTLPANAYLHFSQAFDFEHYVGDPLWYDGGVLEYSTGNGVWHDASSLIVNNGYRGAIASGWGNPLAGRQAFVGTSNGYISTRLNLASLAGQSVQFRWHMALDNEGYDWGWWVDDVQIYTCHPFASSVDVTIGGAPVGSYPVMPATSLRRQYAAVNGGPVQVKSANHVPVVASQRVAYTPDGGTTWTSYGELMGLPAGQLTDTYYFPWYNSANLSSQVSVGNVGTNPTTVTVTIGGNQVDSYTLLASASKRVKYPGLNDGPVVVHSSGGVPIIASERISYTPDGTNYTSYSELMGLPASQLTDTYYFSYYNSVNLSEQVSVGNVGNSSTTVTVTIGGTLVDSYVLTPNQGKRVKYPGINTGPVLVHSTGGVPIISSERISFTPDGGATYTGYSEMMGLPSARLTDTYAFPWYNSVDHSMQVSAANVGSGPTTVTVTINGTVVNSYSLVQNASKRVKYTGVSNGPVVVHSSGGIKIIASERTSYTPDAGVTYPSFSEMLGLPSGLLTDTYVFPWYNNVNLNTEIRFGVP